MEYFWCTSENIPKGLGFSHFGVLHLCWLALMVVLIAGSCLLYRRAGSRGRGIWRKTIALLLIADELFKDIPLWITGTFLVDYLPFQLCSINIFIIAWHAWRPGKMLDNFLYTVCIPGALAAMLFPSWTKLPGWNFMCIHSFTVHILLVMYPVVLFLCGEIRPDIRYLWKSFCLLGAFALVALGLNLIWDTNFMFLMSAAKGNPLYWFGEHWGSHLLGFPVIIAGVVAVLYGPLELWRRWKDRRIA